MDGLDGNCYCASVHLFYILKALASHSMDRFENTNGPWGVIGSWLVVVFAPDFRQSAVWKVADGFLFCFEKIESGSWNMLSDNWCALQLLYSPAAHSDSKLHAGKAGSSGRRVKDTELPRCTWKTQIMMSEPSLLGAFHCCKNCTCSQIRSLSTLSWSGEAAGLMKGVGGLNWGRGERERARVETEWEDSMTFVSMATQPRINMPRLARRTSGTSDSVIVKLSELRLKPSAKLIRAEKGAEDETETRNRSK